MGDRPSVSSDDAETGGARREPATQQQVKDAIEKPAVPVTWSHITTVVQDMFTLAPYRRWVLSRAGIDGFGVDISFEVEAGVVVGGVSVEPTGVSILWITNSEVTAADDGVAVDPVDDNPHFFLFSSTGYSFGVNIQGGAGVNAEYFYAQRYGGGQNTRNSWAGPVVSYDAEVSGKLLAGAEASASYFGSVDYDKTGPNGTLSVSWANSGWHGMSYSGQLEAGVGLELAFGRTATEANSSIVDHFGRPDVRKAMQNADEIPDRLEKGYQRDTTGGSIMGWLADWSSNIGEAVQE